MIVYTNTATVVFFFSFLNNHIKLRYMLHYFMLQLNKLKEIIYHIIQQRISNKRTQKFYTPHSVRTYRKRIINYKFKWNQLIKIKLTFSRLHYPHFMRHILLLFLFIYFYKTVVVNWVVDEVAYKSANRRTYILCKSIYPSSIICMEKHTTIFLCCL